jgi:hypothetical protein
MLLLPMLLEGRGEMAGVSEVGSSACRLTHVFET